MSTLAKLISSVSDVEDASPSAIRDLIKDYLIHTAHVETLKAFVANISEDHYSASMSDISSVSNDDDTTEAREDVAMNDHDKDDSDNSGEEGSDELNDNTDVIIWRKEITTLLRSGKVNLAVEMLNRHFPHVLNMDETIYSASLGSLSPLHSSPVIPISKRPYSTSLNMQSKYTSSSRLQNTHSGSPHAIHPTAAPPTPSMPSPHFSHFFKSLEPSHLALNLDIQAFIESIRTANPISPSSEVYNNFAKNNLVPTALSTSHNHSVTYVESVSSPASDASAISNTSSVLAHALSHAQALHTRAQKLPSASQRNHYISELEAVSALIAYEDPYVSPVSSYLLPERLESLADTVNSAILVQTGFFAEPRLSKIVKQLSVVWSSCQDFQIDVPKSILEKSSAKKDTPKNNGTRTSNVNEVEKNNFHLPDFKLKDILDESV